MEPESPLVRASKIVDSSDDLIHETTYTSTWHCPTGKYSDRMRPDTANTLAARVKETYAPTKRTYKDVRVFNFNSHTYVNTTAGGQWHVP